MPLVERRQSLREVLPWSCYCECLYWEWGVGSGNLKTGSGMSRLGLRTELGWDPKMGLGGWEDWGVSKLGLGLNWGNLKMGLRDFGGSRDRVSAGLRWGSSDRIGGESWMGLGVEDLGWDWGTGDWGLRGLKTGSAPSSAPSSAPAFRNTGRRAIGQETYDMREDANLK